MAKRSSSGVVLMVFGGVVLVSGGVALAVTLRRRQEELGPAPGGGLLPASPAPAGVQQPAPEASGGISPRDVRKIAASVPAPTPPPTIPTPAAAPPPPARTLRVGMSGDDVRGVQLLLVQLGFSVSVDGQFGPETKAAILAFQRQRGLAADGVVGPNTRTALQAAYQEALIKAGAKPLTS